MPPDADALTAPADGGTPPDPAGPPAGDPPGKAPHFDESVRRVGGAAKASVASAVDTGRALRKLVAADFVLARSATGRAVAWLAVAIVFGATTGLLVMGAIVALLRASAGLSWLASIAIAACISLVLTAIASWRVSVFFDYAGMHATRRQLARLGIGDESSHEDKEVPVAQTPTAPAPAGTPGTTP